MFGNKRSNSDGKHDASLSRVKLSTLENTPVHAFRETADDFAEIYGKSKIEATRWFIVAMASIGMCITLVIGMTMLLPLKEVRPWLIEFNAATGVVNKPVEIQKVDPNQMVIKAELAKWTEFVFSIDPLRVQEQSKWANTRTAEKAVSQYAEFRQSEKLFERISREKELIREAKVTAVDLGQKGTAFVYVTTTERQGPAAPSPNAIKRYRVTLNYRLYTPTQEADLMSNPLGMMVTYFSYVEDKAR